MKALVSLCVVMALSVGGAALMGVSAHGASRVTLVTTSERPMPRPKTTSDAWGGLQTALSGLATRRRDHKSRIQACLSGEARCNGGFASATDNPFFKDRYGRAVHDGQRKTVATRSLHWGRFLGIPAGLEVIGEGLPRPSGSALALLVSCAFAWVVLSIRGRPL